MATPPLWTLDADIEGETLRRCETSGKQLRDGTSASSEEAEDKEMRPIRIMQLRCAALLGGQSVC